MKKVIVHVVNSKSFSGLENVVCQIIGNLKDKYDFYYVTQDGDIVNVLKEKGINYYIIDKMSISEIRRMIKKLKPSAVHAHDFRASVICTLATKKIPVISHLHNNSPWLRSYCINSFLYLYAGLRSKKILLVSNSIKEEYIFSKFMRNKMVTINNPVSREKILQSVDSNQLEKKYDICCVARITPQKNIYKFINVIKNVKNEIENIKIVWVGTGEQEIEFKKLIEDNDLGNNITLVGFQKNPYQFMAQSKVFLLTSDWEGYGLVAFEALSLGLPCVVSNVGGLPNIVDSSCGFVSSSETEMVKGVLTLLNDGIKYKAYSYNAFQKAKKLDNFEIYMNNMDKFYSEMIASDSIW